MKTFERPDVLKRVRKSVNTPSEYMWRLRPVVSVTIRPFEVKVVTLAAALYDAGKGTLTLI